MSIVPIRGADIDGAEVSWFAPLCSDDFQYLGVPDGRLRSIYENTARIARRADEPSLLDTEEEAEADGEEQPAEAEVKE